ncbi:unnamed protein product [Paramecium sonneborni]|uniref:Uncharacterized protein n=1 Tax=Paramecium sonneborni TaxID=65129 RepID=A0A8S1NYR1_9CILI|nr:unnamed protein product [Paramecium sonneborni]
MILTLGFYFENIFQGTRPRFHKLLRKSINCQKYQIEQIRNKYYNFVQEKDNTKDNDVLNEREILRQQRVHNDFNI